MKKSLFLVFLLSNSFSYACGCYDDISILNNNISHFNFEKNMPWIAVLLIGITSIIANVKMNKNTLITSKENNQIDFNKSVLSVNRQAWINDLRETVSKILSKSLTYGVTMEMDYFKIEELNFLINKVEFMLNPIKDQEFIRKLKELESGLYEVMNGDRELETLRSLFESVKEFTKITLKTEWERVKKGE